MEKLLWLDDIRDPKVWMGEPVDVEVTWVRSYKEFVEYVETNGIPDTVSFDHDLADIHYDPSTWREGFVYHEETGYDCAKWLVEYCQDNGLSLPETRVHSANPVGAENIRKYLENARKQLSL